MNPLTDSSVEAILGQMGVKVGEWDWQPPERIEPRDYKYPDEVFRPNTRVWFKIGNHDYGVATVIDPTIPLVEETDFSDAQMLQPPNDPHTTVPVVSGMWSQTKKIFWISETWVYEVDDSGADL